MFALEKTNLNFEETLERLNLPILLKNICADFQHIGIDARFNIDVKLPQTFYGNRITVSQFIKTALSKIVESTDAKQIQLNVVFKKLFHQLIEIEFQFEIFDQEISKSIINEILISIASETMTEEIHFSENEICFRLRLKVELEEMTDKVPEDFKILVVDDDNINLFIAEKYINQLKLHCQKSNRGILAVELAKKTSFDLILMDLNMPNLNGYETAKLIREFDSYATIVALTATEYEEIAENMNNSFFNGYMMKPFTIEKLLVKIKESLNTVNIPNHGIKNGFDEHLNIENSIEKLADGNSQFKNELINLYIANIEELKSIYTEAIIKMDGDRAKFIAHKVKTTMTLLHQSELIDKINKGILLVKSGNTNLNGLVTEVSNDCNTLINNLKSINHG